MGGLAPGADFGLGFVTSVANGVSSFITVTRFDRQIWSPAIALALNDLVSVHPDDLNTPGEEFGTLVSGVEYLSILPTVVTARPGLMRITFQAPEPERIVVMPTYTSGHSVTLRAAATPQQPNTAAQLLADITQWFMATM